MTEYITRRVVLLVPVAFLVTIIIFVLVRMAPGDPVLTYAGEERDPEQLEKIRQSLGLDQPLPVQYVYWLGRAVQGDFGRSIRTRQPVAEAIRERLGATLELGLAAVLLSSTVSLFVGTISALKRNSWIDILATGITLGGVSLPNFFLGLVLILIFGLALRMFPPGGYVPFTQDPLGNLHRLILPAITLATASLAVNMRQVRSSLLDVLAQDYIRTARAKGLRQHAVTAGHALKNALIPVVTFAGIYFAILVTTAIVVETVFAWPGLGRLAYEGITSRDFPVIQAVVLTTAAIVTGVNLCVDCLYAFIDPRIRYAR
jgi:ABC-type dipeptide/oligopeptide/nickel transport system permease component